MANEADVPSIALLFQLVWAESAEWIPSHLQQPNCQADWKEYLTAQRADPAVKWVVMDQQDMVIGVGCVRVAGTVALIRDVAVHPEHLRLGMGRRLVQWLEDACLIFNNTCPIKEKRDLFLDHTGDEQLVRVLRGNVLDALQYVAGDLACDDTPTLVQQPLTDAD